MSATEARRKNLERQISRIVGESVCLTVRGERKFTFSTEERCDTLHGSLVRFFGSLATVRTEHDEECGSFAYVEV